jgi:hypothetical protein
MRVSSTPSSDPQFTPDPHRPVVFDRRFDHGPEIVVGFAADIHIAGINAIFRERAGAVRVFAQEQVAVVMEVADNRDTNAEFVQCFGELRDGARGVIRVDGDTDDLRPGLCQRDDLIDRGLCVRRIGIGHRLDDNRVIAADLHTAHADRHRFPARRCRHVRDSSG